MLGAPACDVSSLVLHRTYRMKRTLFLTSIAMIIAVAACHPWDSALEAVLGRLGDAGETSYSDAGDGGSQAGTDAGLTDAVMDAGCTAPLCLTYELRAGESFSSAVNLGPHAFMVVGSSSVGGEQLAVSIDGGFMVRALPNQFNGPREISGTSPDELFVATSLSAVHVKGAAVDRSYSCAATHISSDWHGVSSVSNDEAQFVGLNAALCTWTPDAGFVRTDLNAVGNLVDTPNLYAILMLPNGDRFFAGENGLLLNWTRQGALMSSYQTEGANAQHDMVALSGPSASALWAVGEEGLLARWVPNGVDGGSWTDVPTLNDAPFYVMDIWVRANDDVWVVGEGGYLKHWNGTAWETVAAPQVTAAVDLLSVSGSGSDDLLLAGIDNSADAGQTGLLLYYRR